MRVTIKALCVPAFLILAAVGSLAKPTSPPADNHASIVIVFQDGRRQTVDMADIARIEFEPVASTAGRSHFVGKWQVGEGNGGNFYITLDADGEARKSIGESHGTWTVVAGEARISWDDGWHDAIRKVGSSHEKRAYEPGRSFSDTPDRKSTRLNSSHLVISY